MKDAESNGNHWDARIMESMKDIVSFHLGRDWAVCISEQTAEHLISEARKFGNDVDAAKWIPNEQRKNDYIQLVKDWAAYHGPSLPSPQARRKRKHGCFNEQAWEALSADEQAPCRTFFSSLPGPNGYPTECRPPFHIPKFYMESQTWLLEDHAVIRHGYVVIILFYFRTVLGSMLIFWNVHDSWPSLFVIPLW